MKEHSGNHAMLTMKLSAKVKAQGLAPGDISVVWTRTGSKILAVNGITKEPLQMGSRFTVRDLIQAQELAAETDEDGFRWLSPA